SSWRYIVAHRKDHVNAARLENASWRTWIKAKNNLQTVSPETLNWYVNAKKVAKSCLIPALFAESLAAQILRQYPLLTYTYLRLKECDVTWLYGPLQPPKNNVTSDPAATTLPQLTPFVNKKP